MPRNDQELYRAVKQLHDDLKDVQGAGFSGVVHLGEVGAQGVLEDVKQKHPSLEGPVDRLLQPEGIAAADAYLAVGQVLAAIPNARLSRPNIPGKAFNPWGR